jgi:RNA polymerase sigma factor for flagellar operon FliA
MPLTVQDRDNLILSQLGQVKILARRLHQRCPQVEFDDLVQAGSIGLIQAANRFEPTRGLKLKTLAEHRIRGAMLDFLRAIDPLPRNVRTFQKRRDVLLLERRTSGESTDESSLCQALGITPRKYRELHRMVIASTPLSLSDPDLARSCKGGA